MENFNTFKCEEKQDCKTCPECQDCKKIKKCTRIAIDNYLESNNPIFKWGYQALRYWKLYDGREFSESETRIKNFETYLANTISKRDLNINFRLMWPCGCHEPPVPVICNSET